MQLQPKLPWRGSFWDGERASPPLSLVSTARKPQVWCQTHSARRERGGGTGGRGAAPFLPACPDSAPLSCSLLGTNPCSLPHSQFQGFTGGLTLPCPLPTLNASHRQDEPEFANPTEIIYVSLSKGGRGVGAVFPKECKGLAHFSEHDRALRSQVNHTKRCNVPLGEGTASPDPCAIS